MLAAIWLVLVSITGICHADSNVAVFGIRPLDDTVQVSSDQFLVGETGRKLRMVVFGTNFHNKTKVAFSQKVADGNCVRKRESLPKTTNSITSNSFEIEEFFENPGEWFLCLEYIDSATIKLKPIQSDFVKLKAESTGTPGWLLGLQISAVAVLLVLSGLFSGLNLGLMALNPDELLVVKNVGSEQEKKYASQILPLRKHGNFLLCTLLLGNVIVNTTATILLDGLTGSGISAVFGSAAGIVVFGEIVPQSVCTRHGLAVGARTIWLTKTFMVLTAVISWPLSKLLDCLFGEEIGQRNNRDKFVEMAKLSQQKGDEHFDPNTVAIIDGAFQLKEKVVRDVMTPIEKVFMIDYNEKLTFELRSKISENGYTRIPVYKKEENTRNIVSILFVKDLIFIDPADNMPIKAICDHFNHQLMFTYEEITLDQMLAEFKTGSSHMAIVQKPVSVPGMDPYYEITGVVTLEDVFEEMIGSEIIDETDKFVDNTGRHRANRHRKMDFKVFINQPTSTVFPPQLKLACYQYLHSEIEGFRPATMHSSVLKKLMECNVLFEVKADNLAAPDGEHVLYKKNVPSEYFTMILEGRAMISVGKDNLKFEAGPFHYFGTCLLNSNSGQGSSGGVNGVGVNNEDSSAAAAAAREAYFVPDFTATATTNLVIFKIKQKHYMAAVKASRLLYDQAVVYEKRSVGSSEASPDDMDSKTNEIKEMAQVERILSDELSKVDANDKILVPTIHELTSQSNESVTASNNSGEGVPGKNVRFVATDNAGAKNLPNVKFSSSSPDQTPDQAQQDDPPDGANNAEKEGKEDKNESKV
ncbi:metal transporter CNNM4-like isoform X2 [Convolutriloba macropyga]|uniref:metal transporter CNNM4-like isoform X2 n=1 Tax=Convolutriloba macropyga TaxID=536237 RepID=UPI003F51E2DB